MKSLHVLLLTGMGLALLAGVGCEKPLFPDNTARSPYERYMVLRGEDRPAKEFNAFGGEEPALRARLRPLGQ